MITGIGAFTPLGQDMPSTWENLIAGKSGIAPITIFDASNMEVKFAGEVKGFNPELYINKKDIRRMDRFAQLGVAAGLQAVKNANLTIDEDNRDDIGVFIGSGIGGLTTLFEQAKVLVEKGPDRVSPFLAPMMISDIAAAQISIALGVRGPNMCMTSACSSGSDAIGSAAEYIKYGNAEVMIAGGAEAIVNPRKDAPEKASRPFDLNRNGFVIAEGSVVFILESMEHALRRGANIMAEIIGYGATADSFHVTQPLESGAGAAKAMQMAMKRGNIKPDEIDYVNAHGTSTQLNDAMETKAIKTALGARAYQIPISSTKSMLGHMIGCAGAIGPAVCVMTIQTGMVHPTINYETPDPACDLDYVPNTARKANVTTTMTNSFGFGGHNSVLILRKFSEAI